MVKEHYIREKGKVISEDAVLAVYNKNLKILEKDIVFLRKEIPPQYQKRYTRAQLVDYLVLWDLAYLEAKSMGFLEQAEVVVALEKEIDEYWAKAYEDSVVKNTFTIDTLELKKKFRDNKAFFVKDSSEVYSDKMNRDISVFMAIDPLEFKLEYATQPDKYMKDSVKLSYDEAKYKIFKNLKRKYRQRPRERMIEQLKEKYGVKVYDPLYEEEKLSDPLEAFKLAQNFHNDRKLDDALKQYKKVRLAFAGKEHYSLQDSVCMAMAQVYVEQEKYKDALAEYRRLLFLYPESSNNYKAQFMIGFIYAENLNKNGLAIKAFKELLSKYPNCDLADDADWMIRNIESGGALMPVLEDS